MATCKQTATELIQDIFSPCVAILCSSDVDSVCAKNNLTFVEMIQPFCHLNTEVTIRDPSNVSNSIRNLRLNMREMTFQVPPSNVSKKLMHDAVANNAAEGVLCNSVSDSIYSLKYSASTPWFEAYRDAFFQIVSPTEHEFMHHYLSCIFVVSSSNSDPLNQIQQLCQEQQQAQLRNSHYNSQWFFTHIFKYYLLLHDTTSENLAKAEAIYQSMKSCYGASSCHLLQINSCSPKDDINNVNPHEEMKSTSNLPDPWSQFLTKFYTHSDFNEIPISNNVTIENNDVQGHVEPDFQDEIESCLPDTNNKVTIDHPLLNNSEVTDSPNKTQKKEDTKSSLTNTWKCNSNRNKKHGLCLTPSDMDRIRLFIQEFCIQGLVPFVEKNIRILSDQVANRKSIHRTLFGVTKKLFTGNRPGVPGPITSTNSVVYGHDAPELQVRKLGDLAFMFQLYEVAYQAYHTAKRDFSGEVWLHFAGASEMAALSVFMQGNSNLHEYPARYMEAAITTYLYTCKLSELAVRATFLSTECLKVKNLFRDAGLQFSRILIEADLPSALLLEQAAHCAVSCKPLYIRKYMFNLILAGHRFSKCGQRKHSLRAYKQVEQLYEQLGWNAARNHVKSLIGRTSAHLKQTENAYNAFYELLSAQSEQASVDQSNCLRDYLMALKEYVVQQPQHENFRLQILPIPIINCQSTKVLLGEENQSSDDVLVVNGRGFEHGDLDNEVWAQLEGMMLSSLLKIQVAFPQLYCYTQLTDNIHQPTCIANESISVEIALQNPLSLSFAMDNVFLLWTFTTNPDINSNKDPVSFSNELEVSKSTMVNSIVETKILPEVVLEPFQESKLHLTLRPVHSGTLLIKGLSYNLRGPLSSAKSPTSSVQPKEVLSLQGKHLIEVKGPRLNKTAADRTSKSYAIDNRLNLQVVPSLPKLQVKFKSFPTNLFCGEVKQSSMDLINVGTQPMQRIIVASATPSLFVISLKSPQEQPLQIHNEVPCPRRPAPQRAEWEECDWKMELRTSDGEPCCLDPGESISLNIWFRGPDVPGKYNLQLLFYYETELEKSKLKHRLLQYSSVLNAKPSLNIQAKVVNSQSFPERLDDNSYSANSMLLSLIAGNSSEELSRISIVQVSCISPKFHLSSSDELIPKTFPVILQKECLLLTLKASSLQLTQNTDSSRKSMVISHVPLGHFEIDSSASPCRDFINKSRIKQDFLTLDDRTNYDILKSENILFLLTVMWKAEVEYDGVMHVITGQHHMSIENFASPLLSQIAAPSSNLAHNPVDDQFIRCYLNHPFQVQHDFNQSRIVTVPVKFIVQNICNLPLQIHLDNSDGTLRSMPYSLEENQAPMSQFFVWINGSKRIILLDAEKTATVALQASFFSPGTYNLGCLNVKVMSGNDVVMNYIMSPFLIIISTTDAPT